MRRCLSPAPLPARLTAARSLRRASGADCTWQRRLCVSCIAAAGDAPVRMRIRSNGMPRTCFRYGEAGVFAPVGGFPEKNIDFAVDFNPAVAIDAASLAPVPRKDVSTSGLDAAQLSELMCAAKPPPLFAPAGRAA